LLVSTHKFIALLVPSYHWRLEMVQARFLLGDSDDPECSWIIGQHGELFEYRLLGIHRVTSGFTSILHVPDALLGKRKELVGDLFTSLRSAVPRNEWEALRQGCKGHLGGLEGQGREAWMQMGVEMLFAGHLEACSSASVYLKKDSEGLLLSSNYGAL
jgi:hypothetical protein